MSGLRMSQVPRLAGLRGLGAESCPPGHRPVGGGCAWTGEEEWPKPTGRPTAQQKRLEQQYRTTGTVSRGKADAKTPAQLRPVDQSRTYISMPSIARRPRRVSPLSASWEFGMPQPGVVTDFGPGPRLGWGVVLGGVAFGVAALYLIFKD